MRLGFLLFSLLATSFAAAQADLDSARKLYNRTDFEGSLKVLLAAPDKDAAMLDLIGKNYFMLGDFKKATEFYEKAVAAAPGNSQYEHWLGKAYGRRAETSSPFTAPGYASKARQHFERAASLDPMNLEACNDLFEYYLQAPGFLGGGLDKAARMAEHIAGIDVAEGHWALAKIAEKRKQYGQTEEQLRRALELAPMQVGRFVDLAKFLARQGRYQESEQVFLDAERVAPDSPKLLFQRAETYIHTGRNLDEARELLKRYISTTWLSPDDPPRSEAQKLLKEAGS